MSENLDNNFSKNSFMPREPKKNKRKVSKLEWLAYIFTISALSLVLFIFFSKNNNKSLVSMSDEENVDLSLSDDLDSSGSLDDLDDLSLADGAESDIESAPIEDLSDSQNKLDSSTQNTPTRVEPSTSNITPVKKTSTPTKKKPTVKKKAYFSAFSKDQQRLVPVEEYNHEVLSRFESKPNDQIYLVGEYSVKSGDSIWIIARKLRVSAINLIAINTSLTDPDVLEKGNSLFVPNV